MCGYHMRFGKIRKVVGSLFELWKDRKKDVHYGEAVWAVENGQELHSSLENYYSSYIFQEDDDRREELMFLLPALFSLYWHMTLKFSERERKRGFYDTTMYVCYNFGFQFSLYNSLNRVLTMLFRMFAFVLWYDIVYASILFSSFSQILTCFSWLSIWWQSLESQLLIWLYTHLLEVCVTTKTERNLNINSFSLLF